MLTKLIIKPPAIPKSNRWFTLVELITVLVILGIVASMGSSFLATTLKMYQRTSERVALMQKGRVAMEQMSRYLRSALPNAVRISTSGKCVEFLPIAAGGYYTNNLPDSANGGTAVNFATIAPLSYSGTGAQYFVVSPLSSADIFTTAAVSSRVAVSSLTSTQVNFSSTKVFARNSVPHRFFLASYPKRFCMVSGNLQRYSNYGFSTSSLDDSNPGGSADLMLNGLSQASSYFSLSAGSETRNMAVNIRLVLISGSEQVTLNHQVLVRNVP